MKLKKEENDSMNHKGTQTMETERLILRRFEIEDTEYVFSNWASDPQVTKYLTWPAHETIGDTEWIMRGWLEKYENHDFYHWAIVLKELGQPVGGITITNMNDKTGCVEIGYSIGRKWWHMGITSEAMQAVIEFCFEEINTNRVEAAHDPRNIYSGKVMQKCKMICEGTLRQQGFNNQGIADTCVYSILKSEYKKNKKAGGRV